MRKNFELIKGDTLAFAVEIAFDEDPVDADEMLFTVKRNADDGNLFQVAKVGNKLYYRVRVSPWHTRSLEAGLYQYDLEIRVNGDIFTILNGLLIVENEITEF